MRLIAVCIAALSLAACGVATDGGGAAGSPTPSEIPLPTSPSAGFDVLITDQDRAVAVQVGQRIEVFLRTRPGMTDWKGISADDTAVLRPVATGITAVRGASVAGFVAQSPGVANITAVAGAQCAPNQACPMYAMLFSVRVTVT